MRDFGGHFYKGRGTIVLPDPVLVCLPSFSPPYKLREWGQPPPFHNEREQGRYPRAQRAGMLRYGIQGI